MSIKRKILPLKKHKGLCIYCPKCKTNYYWSERTVKKCDNETKKEHAYCKREDTKFISCPNFRSHKFKAKVYIPGSNNKTTNRCLQSNNYNGAVIKSIEFQQEILTIINQTPDYSQIIGKRHYLFECQIDYLQFLDNVDVPAHMHADRTDSYKREVQRFMEMFNSALDYNGINKKFLTLEKISDKHVGLFYTYIFSKEQNGVKSYSNKYYNKIMICLRGFFKWAIKNWKLMCSNPFEDVKSRTTETNLETITSEEFKKLISVIKPENGVTHFIGKANKKRNYYRPYLINAFRLSLHTGGRREEITSMKWNMIKSLANGAKYIEVKNLKVERSKGEGFNGNTAPKIIPITKGLSNLLMELGYEQNKNNENYILCPNRENLNTNTIIENMSKGFSHFYNLLETKRSLQFNCLRKTYLSYLNSTLNSDTKSLSSHSNSKVLEKHYIDPKVINKAILNLNILG